MPETVFTYPRCSGRLSVRDDLLGCWVRCPHCHRDGHLTTHGNHSRAVDGMRHARAAAAIRGSAGLEGYCERRTAAFWFLCCPLACCAARRCPAAAGSCLTTGRNNAVSPGFSWPSAGLREGREENQAGGSRVGPGLERAEGSQYD
jgi:hypothetical protein